MKKHKKQTSRTVGESPKSPSFHPQDIMGAEKVPNVVRTISSWHLDRLLNPYWAGRTANRM